MAWHAWHRGGAAAVRAFGAALRTITAAARWDNKAKANRYASLPPGWEFHLPGDIPCPTPAFSVRTAPVHTHQVWALRTLDPQAPAPPLMSALGTVGAKGPLCAQGLACPSQRGQQILLVMRIDCVSLCRGVQGDCRAVQGGAGQGDSFQNFASRDDNLLLILPKITAQTCCFIRWQEHEPLFPQAP